MASDARADASRLLFYGDPLIVPDEDTEGAAACMLCKAWFATADALDAHLASTRHAEQVAKGLADGRVTRAPTASDRAWNVVSRSLAAGATWFARPLLSATNALRQSFAMLQDRDRLPNQAQTGGSQVTDEDAAPPAEDASSDCSTSASSPSSPHVVLTLRVSVAGTVVAGMVVARTVRVKYAIIGAGQCGLLFAHRCVASCAGTCALIDKRTSIGGHWIDQYTRRSHTVHSPPNGMPCTLLTDDGCTVV
jgi:hypothetical protein